MMLWKMWYDLRFRFFICLAFLIVHIMFLIAIFPVAGSLVSWFRSDIPKQDWESIRQLISSYSYFMDHGWFQEVKYISALAVIFSLGGVLTERKMHSIYFTLSLPVLRRRWILFQSGMAFFLITILCIAATALILIAGIAYGSGYPILRAIQGTLFLTLIALPWIGATFAVASMTQDRMKTALIVFGCWFFMGILQSIPAIRLWLPRHLIDYYMGNNSFPWQSLIVILAAGIGGILFAIHRFEKEDF
jgi:hypothetical protein